MFQLNLNEYKSLRSQFVTLEKGRGHHRKYLPYVFTQDGVAMLSSILRSRRAIKVNIQIIRAFNRRKDVLTSHQKLRDKIREMEKKYVSRFAVVFEVLQTLLDGPQKPVWVKGFSDKRETGKIRRDH